MLATDGFHAKFVRIRDDWTHTFRSPIGPHPPRLPDPRRRHRRLVAGLDGTQRLGPDGRAGRPEARSCPASRRRSKVLILGGGFSGMVVGYELGKLGYDYQVLEARERVGGTAVVGAERRRAHRSRRRRAPGLHVRRGPLRQCRRRGAFPTRTRAVLNYCRELSVPVQVFLNESDANYFYFEERPRAAGEQEGPPARGQGRPHRPDQRAAGEGARSEQARPAADRRRSEAPHRLS